VRGREIGTIDYVPEGGFLIVTYKFLIYTCTYKYTFYILPSKRTTFYLSMKIFIVLAYYLTEGQKRSDSFKNNKNFRYSILRYFQNTNKADKSKGFEVAVKDLIVSKMCRNCFDSSC
jgi:hypothetical protein